MGSRLTKEQRAYIAGFLDGDGSLMLQVKRRKDTSIHWRFMATICLYQDSRHQAPLLWMKRILRIGYISHRNDGMTELRINGYQQVLHILEQLLPYLRFKKPQAQAIVKACKILVQKPGSRLTNDAKERLCAYCMCVQQHNYRTHYKKTLQEFRAMVGLTP